MPAIIKAPAQRVTLGHRLRVGDFEYTGYEGNFTGTRVIVRVLRAGREPALTLESDDEESGLDWSDGTLTALEFTPEQITTIHDANGTKSICRITLEGDDPLIELDLLAEFELVIIP